MSRRVIPSSILDIIAFFVIFAGVNEVMKSTPSDAMLSKITEG